MSAPIVVEVLSMIGLPDRDLHGFGDPANRHFEVEVDSLTKSDRDVLPLDRREALQFRLDRIDTGDEERDFETARGLGHWRSLLPVAP